MRSLLLCIISVCVFIPSCTTKKSQNLSEPGPRGPRRSGKPQESFIIDQRRMERYQSYLKTKRNKDNVALYLEFMEKPDAKKEFARVSKFQTGEIEIGTSIVPDENTIFEIGAITETFIAVLFADMVQKGEINPDEKVKNILPSMILPPYAMDITLMHLATHTSGIEDRYAMEWALPINMKEEKVYSWLSVVELGKPGEKYIHSSLGVGLLAYFLSQKAGTSLDELLHKRIFEPLNMKHTSYSQESHDNFAMGYHSGRSASFYTNRNVPTMMTSSMGMHSNAYDLRIWLNAHLFPDSSKIGSAIKKSRELNQKVGLLWKHEAYGKHSLSKIGSQAFGFETEIGFADDSSFAYILLSNSDDHTFSDLPENLLDPKDYDLIHFVKPVDALNLDYEISTGAEGIYVNAKKFPVFRIESESNKLFIIYNGERREIYKAKNQKYYMLNPPGWIRGDLKFELELQTIKGLSISTEWGELNLTKTQLKTDLIAYFEKQAEGKYNWKNKTLELTSQLSSIELKSEETGATIRFDKFSDGAFYHFQNPYGAMKLSFLRDLTLNVIGLELSIDASHRQTYRKVKGD